MGRGVSAMQRKQESLVEKTLMGTLMCAEKARVSGGENPYVCTRHSALPIPVAAGPKISRGNIKGKGEESTHRLHEDCTETTAMQCLAKSSDPVIQEESAAYRRKEDEIIALHPEEGQACGRGAFLPAET